MQRKVIHVDMDAFFASVEQRDFPQYRGRPVIVGGRPESRGVVAACSYEARRFGVHSAMPSSRALRLCPDAVFLPPRFEVYRQCSAAIHDIFHQYTDLIEPLSLDEAYLDVSDCDAFSGCAVRIARAIRGEIQSTLRLTASAGVAHNKFLAKLASDMDKPNGMTVIAPDDALALVAGLPVRRFHGIGRATEAKMQALEIHTGADLRRQTEDFLTQSFGRAGHYYYRIARAIDDRPVVVSRQRKSIGKETTFSRDMLDKREIWESLLPLVDKVCERLNDKALVAKTVTVKVRYHNFELVTRSQSVAFAIRSSEQVVSLLPELLRKTEAGRRPVRLIGVALSNLDCARVGEQFTHYAGVQRQFEFE